MIIAIANQKGGVGKTTVAAHLAHYLASHHYQTLAIDADPQANLTSWLCGTNEQNGLYDLIMSRTSPNILTCIHPLSNRLAIIPGNSDTADAMIAHIAMRLPFDHISKRINQARGIAEITLIDMPPSRAAGFQELLFAADLVLVPTTLEQHALEGVSLMAQAIADLQAEHNHAPALLGIVPNRAKRAAHGLVQEHQARLQELIDTFGATVWPPVIDTIRVPEATGYGETMFTYQPHHPATDAIRAICQRVLVNSGIQQ